MSSAALQRHSATPCDAVRGIEISVARYKGKLQVDFRLEGEIERLRVPPPRPSHFAERLWEHTCFEIFIAREGVAGYREFNFSPSGEWAAYAFTRYREGGPLRGVRPGIAVRLALPGLELSASIPMEEGKLSLGLSAVIEEESGALSYWALRHAPGKPDFHHPQTFAMTIE
jgi:hypothetical protein